MTRSTTSVSPETMSVSRTHSPVYHHATRLRRGIPALQDYLNCAVELMFFAHCTIRDVLEVMDRIRARLPRVEEIWEFSSRAENLGEAVKRTLEIAEQLQSGVAAGTLKMDSLVSTDML